MQILYDIIEDATSILHLIGLISTFLAFLSWILATSYAHIVLSHQHSNLKKSDSIKRSDQAEQMKILAASHAANILGKNSDDKSTKSNNKMSMNNNNNTPQISGNNNKTIFDINSPAESESSYSVASSGIGITPVVTPMASPASKSKSTRSISNLSPMSSASNITPLNISNINASDNNIDSITNTEQYVLNSLVDNPDALVNWRVRVPSHGIGLVRRVVRKKFRTTRYDVLFTNGHSKLLKLRRASADGSVVKGNISFELVDKKN